MLSQRNNYHHFLLFRFRS